MTTSGAVPRPSAAPPLALLYVPADRPERVVKALASGADAVLVDLEDAVAPAAKPAARENLAGLLSDLDGPAPQGPSGGPAVQVRVNHAGTPWHADDVDAVRALPVGVGVRVPKVESADEVRALAAALPGRALHLLLESALGVERAFDLATASPQVASLALGEADLRSDLRVDDEAGLAWPRSRVVVAARAAGLPAPVMSAYTHVRDLDGLDASCRAGRALGFWGRTAIHPAQLATIRTAFAPAPDEVARAREVVRAVADATGAGTGTVVLPDGTFLDVAMVERARWTLAVHARAVEALPGPREPR
ncbi:HpcH/HpaI aldolase/citrate lyase family protein [Isoptericola sp. NPDC057191]|uniref:HpcH/HpaI aldolase/citrate lyase family protein n=1 Tax=Isoptericola sp. NPDC057191 TaxID=3346041 RepID=UPI003637EE77